MKEARIECLIREFPIPDLGLVLKQGQVEFVDLDVARRSKDLPHAKQIGAVGVRYVERARMTRKLPAPPRPPPPPNMRLPRRRMFPAPAEPTAAPAGNIDEFKAAAAEAARDATREAMGEMRDILQEALASRPAVVAPGFPGTTAPAPLPYVGAPEPMFIPDNIVNKDATIQVTSDSTDAGDMDEVSKTLKAQRGSRPPRGSREKKKE